MQLLFAQDSQILKIRHDNQIGYIWVDTLWETYTAFEFDPAPAVVAIVLKHPNAIPQADLSAQSMGIINKFFIK